MVIENFETTCTDKVILKGRLLLAESPKAVVQFNCGTAVNREIYSQFLFFLVENGYSCCLWDYRGNGESLNEPLKDCVYRYADYGTKEMTAIKAFLNNRFPDKKIIIIGHSAGGQQIGFMKELDNVAGIINFAVSSGYYPYMPLPYRIKAYFFFYIFSPLSNLLNGYVKAKPFGLMENLPNGVVNEWRQWLESKDLFFHKRIYGITVPEGCFKNFKIPIHNYRTVDDSISNKKNIEAFWKHIKSESSITFTRLEPKEFNMKKIDHFGFFKRKMKEGLWTDVVSKMDGIILGSKINVFKK